MGACISSTNVSDDEIPKQGTKASRLPSTSKSRHRASTSHRGKPRVDHSPTPSSSKSHTLRSDLLSPHGYINETPSWFPSQNAHRDISKLFDKIENIGSGCTGKIYSVCYRDNICAVKQIKRDDEFGRMLFTTEARSLSKLKHRSIIKYVDMLMDEKYYYLILEKADYDLYHIMRHKGYISEKKTKKIMYNLINAIYYIHKKNLVHRDLKPENIVFFDNDTDRPMLIDFGDAEMCKKGKVYTEFVGTPPYMSPERLGEHNADQLKKADVWALGVMAYEMFSGKRCFEGDSQKQVFRAILNGQWNWKPDRLPSEAMMDFVSKCLNLDYEKRLSAKEALEHRWFDDIDEIMNKNTTNLKPGQTSMHLQSSNDSDMDSSKVVNINLPMPDRKLRLSVAAPSPKINHSTKDIDNEQETKDDTDEHKEKEKEEHRHSQLSTKTKEPVSNDESNDTNNNNITESVERLGSDKHLSPTNHKFIEKVESTGLSGDESIDNSPIDDHGMSLFSLLQKR